MTKRPMADGEPPVPSRSARSLVARARHRLREGPLHTREIAHDVLGLTGHRGAVAATVYRLLGSNPRFAVDHEGVWSLAEVVEPTDPLLSTPIIEQPFAVVDVETSGRKAGSGGAMVEIAIVEVLGGEIISEYETLLNPGCRLPRFITSLTGITNAMVVGAPSFEHVADEVAARLTGRVFVAQNVGFDWGFVSAELQASNRDVPQVPRVCTAEAARRFVPSLRRRNLDSLAHHFGIRMTGRHRAYPDALATARILLRLLDEACGRGIDDVATLLWYVRRRRRSRVFDPRQHRLTIR